MKFFVDTADTIKQRLRTFITNTRHTRYVIDLVAFQRQKVDD